MRLLTILLGCIIAAPVHAAFSDTANHKYADSIEFVKNRGIVGGYSDGSYKPDRTINRAEFAKIIHGAIRPSGFGTYEHECFPDIPFESWFEGYVCDLQGSILGGNPDGLFHPDRTINFVEAAKVVATAFTLPGYGAASAGEWWEPYVEALKLRNAIPDPSIQPADLLTRGQMARMIHRVMAPFVQDENAIIPLSIPKYTDFRDEVIGNGMGSVLFFHAAWCPYCIKNDQRLTGWFSDPGPDFPIYSVYKIDYDDRTDLRQRYGVTSQDTFILIDREGNEVERLSFPSESSLYDLLDMPPISN